MKTDVSKKRKNVYEMPSMHANSTQSTRPVYEKHGELF